MASSAGGWEIKEYDTGIAEMSGESHPTASYNGRAYYMARQSNYACLALASSSSKAINNMCVS